ncbi:MAG: hypothetical protein ACRYFX_28770 [Janthinobacterium lividum]
MKSYRYVLLNCLLPLAASLLLYTLFRTRDTIVNQVIIHLLSFRPPVLQLPQAPWVVYNLPGALWLYAFLWFTSLSRSKFLTLLPLGLALGIEAVQLLHLTDGTFDGLDVLFYLLSLLAFVGLGGMGWVQPGPQAAVPRQRLSLGFKCVFAFFIAIVVLSDVWVK